VENTMRAARRAFDRGDLKGALREDDAAIQLKPEYDAAWLLRGHIFRKDGNMPGAIEAFAQALKINGESQEGWLGLASALHEVGRFQEEGEAYDRLLKIHPRSIEAWIDKGAALQLGPDFYDAMANRVLLYRKMKRHGETVLWADRALRFREAPWLWHVKGTAHLGLRESTLAIKAFEHALALDPKSKEARAGLRKAKTLHETTDFYRGVYECFGTLLAGIRAVRNARFAPVAGR